jgi:hypothetical protein
MFARLVRLSAASLIWPNELHTMLRFVYGLYVIKHVFVNDEFYPACTMYVYVHIYVSDQETVKLKLATLSVQYSQLYVMLSVFQKRKVG